MEFTKRGLAYWDIAWFGIDQTGAIGYFTTGIYGGLPDSIIESKQDWDSVCDFFMDEFTENTEGEFDLNCCDHITLTSDNSIQAKRLAFAEYVDMSTKGLYSYDSYDTKSDYGNYFRVSYPIEPLKLDKLPIPIQNILKKTQIKNIDFRQGKDIELPSKIC